MNNEGMISVIVPVYKVERYLKRCVDSILAQTYKYFELILVDDGSPDNCPQICDSYAEKDSRVRVLHKPNGGLSSARNAGLDAARGKYIGFVDSDDFIAPNMYEKLMEALIQNDADLAMCNFNYVDENGKKTRQKELYPLKNETVTSEQIRNGWGISYNKSAIITQWNKLYRTSVFDCLRYPEGMLCEDAYIAPYIYHGHKVTCIADKLYYYTQRKDSIMGSTNLKLTKDTITAYNAAIKFYKAHNYAAGFITSKMEALLWALGAYASLCQDVPKIEKTEYYRQTLAEIRTMLCESGLKDVPFTDKMKLILEAVSPKYAYVLAKILGRARE